MPRSKNGESARRSSSKRRAQMVRVLGAVMITLSTKPMVPPRRRRSHSRHRWMQHAKQSQRARVNPTATGMEMGSEVRKTVRRRRNPRRHLHRQQTSHRRSRRGRCRVQAPRADRPSDARRQARSCPLRRWTRATTSTSPVGPVLSAEPEPGPEPERDSFFQISYILRQRYARRTCTPSQMSIVTSSMSLLSSCLLACQK